MKGSKFTEEEFKKIGELISKGYASTLIAIKMKRAKNSILRHVRSGGGRENYSWQKALENNEKQHSERGKKSSNLRYFEKREVLIIKDMILEGNSYLSIARVLNRSISFVCKIVKLGGGVENFNEDLAFENLRYRREETEEQKISYEDRICVLEMQVQILLETLKKVKND